MRSNWSDSDVPATSGLARKEKERIKESKESDFSKKDCNHRRNKGSSAESWETTGPSNAPSIHHLSEYTSNAPNVDRCAVLATSHEDVRSAIPQRDHLVSVGTDRNTKSSRKSKICEL